jgi:hypothetical protein
MIKKLFTAVALLGALQACSTVPVDQMTFNDGLVTSAANGYPFQETPMTQIRQRDSLIIVTHVRWEPLTSEGGRHAVSWTWYADGKVVAVRNRDETFKKSPFRFIWRIPASDFDLGHYRVDVAIDGKVVDTHEYDIVK